MPDINYEINDETHALHVTISTERFYLESVIKENRLHDYILLFANPINVALYGYGVPLESTKTEAVVSRWSDLWKNNDPFSSLDVVKNDTDEFIGQTVLGYGDDAGQAELAYIIDNRSWGHGYGTEAATVVVQ